MKRKGEKKIGIKAARIDKRLAIIKKKDKTKYAILE